MTYLTGTEKISGQTPSLDQWNNWSEDFILLHNSFPVQEVQGCQVGVLPLLLNAAASVNPQMLYTQITQYPYFTTDNNGQFPFGWVPFQNGVLAVFTNWIRAATTTTQITVGCAKSATTLSGTTLQFWDAHINKPAKGLEVTLDFLTILVFGW